MMPPTSGPPAMHWFMGRRKQGDSGPANSGLTGDPGLELPPEPEGPKDLRGRWQSLKQSVTGTTAALPRVLRRFSISPILNASTMARDWPWLA